MFILLIHTERRSAAFANERIGRGCVLSFNFYSHLEQLLQACSLTCGYGNSGTGSHFKRGPKDDIHLRHHRSPFYHRNLVHDDQLATNALQFHPLSLWFIMHSPRGGTELQSMRAVCEPRTSAHPSRSSVAIPIPWNCRIF